MPAIGSWACADEGEVDGGYRSSTDRHGAAVFVQGKGKW